MINPNDFAVHGNLFVPYTKEEKEKASQDILSELNAVPLDPNIQVRFVGWLPNGTYLYAVDNRNE